jgi:hypothetical protein
VYAYASGAGFGVGGVYVGRAFSNHHYLFFSHGVENYYGLPVRAAVSLPSNILSNETGDGTISNPYTLK